MFGWRRKPVSQPHSIIDRDTEIRGPLHSRGVLEIRGFVIGEIVHRGQLVIAPGGICTGPVRADELYLRGEVHGDVAVSGTLRIGNGGQLFGDASCRRLIIDAGGRFVGKNLSGSDEEPAQPAPQGTLRVQPEPAEYTPLSKAEALEGVVAAQPEPAQRTPVPEVGTPEGITAMQPEPAQPTPMPAVEAPQGTAPVQPEPAQPTPTLAVEAPQGTVPVQPEPAQPALQPAAEAPQGSEPPAQEPQTIVFRGFMRTRRTTVGLAPRDDQ